MTQWTRCRVKGCAVSVLGKRGVPQYCPEHLKERRQELYLCYLHKEAQA